jgi:hypothetical protein
MTWANWAVALLGALGGFGGAAGVAALLNVFFSKGKLRADAAQVITGTAMTLVKELEDQITRTRDELGKAQTELRKVRLEAEKLARELRLLREAIVAPTATVEGLRSLVHRENGGRRSA